MDVSLINKTTRYTQYGHLAAEGIPSPGWLYYAPALLNAPRLIKPDAARLSNYIYTIIYQLYYKLRAKFHITSAYFR